MTKQHLIEADKEVAKSIIESWDKLGHHDESANIIAAYRNSIESELIPFKDAYSRALNFVAERNYPSLPGKCIDEMFNSPTGNCCAVDILIEKVKELESAKPSSRKGSSNDGQR
jgi:hypothetical protein